MPDSESRDSTPMSSTRLSYKAAAASVCITPEEPLWLAGYATRTKPARGKISDLYASALALEDSAGQRFVIASTDVIAVTPAISEPVAEVARTRHGLSRKQLLLAATHTHYAPEFRADKQAFFSIPDEYAARFPNNVERISTALTQAIDQAFERLVPARLIAGKASANFAHNRRNRSTNVADSPDNVVDHDVPLLDCVDAAGRHIAVVFSYACHNTTIDPDDLRYCGDWAGFAKETLQQAHPGLTALFVPGAGADQDPQPRGTIDLSRQHGQQIADAIQQAMAGPGIEITGPIQVEWEDVDLALETRCRDTITKMLKCDDPPQQVKAQYLLASLERGETLISSYPAPIQVVRLGSELAILALSGEPVVEWAHKLKDRFEKLTKSAPSNGEASAHHPPLIWVAGYCNDMFGYLPTRRVQTEGGYEGGRANLWSWIPAPFADDVEDRVTEAVARLVAKTSERQHHFNDS